MQTRKMPGENYLLPTMEYLGDLAAYASPRFHDMQFQSVINSGSLANARPRQWEMSAPPSLPAHLNSHLGPAASNYNRLPQQPTIPHPNFRAPDIFYDQGFWQRYRPNVATNLTGAASTPNIYSSDQINGVQLQLTSSGQHPSAQTQRLLLSPLPPLNWADRCELWANMLQKDLLYTRNPSCLCRHPTLQPKMRSVLLSWMTEVCEVYKLHRETYYLAVDLLDRFLTVTQQEIAKNNLQLVGITALFIAAKIEEIYPPKVRDFAYVTDGACLVEEIKRMEVIILGTLDWQLCPMTVIGWLSTFLQIAYLSDMSGRELSSAEVVIPRYSRDFFVCMAQILDLCVLDVESLRFPYSHLAASALYHLTNRHITQAGSGISIEALLPCIEWMRPFVETLIERGFAETHVFEGVTFDEQHTIQTHAVDFELLDAVHKKAAEKRLQQNARTEQRELFAAQQRLAWSALSESPMRQTIQLLPPTPTCTPPDTINKPSEAFMAVNSVKMGHYMQPVYTTVNDVAFLAAQSSFFPSFSYSND